MVVHSFIEIVFNVRIATRPSLAKRSNRKTETVSACHAISRNTRRNAVGVIVSSSMGNITQWIMTAGIKSVFGVKCARKSCNNSLSYKRTEKSNWYVRNACNFNNHNNTPTHNKCRMND